MYTDGDQTVWDNVWDTMKNLKQELYHSVMDNVRCNTMFSIGDRAWRIVRRNVCNDVRHNVWFNVGVTASNNILNNRHRSAWEDDRNTTWSIIWESTKKHVQARYENLKGWLYGNVKDNT